MSRKELLKAIRCCRESKCNECPFQEQICDDIRVEMEDIPVELLDMIEKELEEQ